jgi:hypothetical protein
MTKISLSLDNIQSYLRAQGVEVELQTSTNQLCILCKVADREYPIFIRIYDGDELLQLLAFLPCNTNPQTFNDTARLLHLLNKELDLPGFGMDEDQEVVFYRCMIPIKDKKIDADFLNSYLTAVQTVCQSFAAVVAGVSYGAATFDEIMKKVKEQGDLSLTQAQLRQE